MPSNYIVEPLDPRKHDREAFICEEKALNDYIRKHANRDSKTDISRCFVISTEDNPGIIRGYYTLSATSISLSTLPPKIAKKLPNRDQVPATLLGRIARDLSYKNENVGQHLMYSALHRARNASLEVASHGIVLDPKNERLAAYYQHYGFFRIQEGSKSFRMFLPMKDLRSKFIAD